MSESGITKDQRETGPALDAAILMILKHGRKVVVKIGKGKEKVLKISPSASDLNVARQRQKDLGLNIVKDDTDPLADLEDRIDLDAVDDLPDVSMEEDEATG